MPTKVKSRLPKTDLSKTADLVQPRAKGEVAFKRQRLMDLGFMDHDTNFEMPDGSSPLLYDVRFENGGVRKDFGFTNMGTPAPARVADIAHYAYVDPVTLLQVNRIVRIYRNPTNGLATIDFWNGSAWADPVQGEEMEDVLVKATVMQGILAFADGKRIHFYEEADTDILVGKQDFLDAATGLPVTEGMTAEGQYQRVLIPDEPLGDTVTLNWRVDCFTGGGKITIRGFVPVPGGPIPGGASATLFRRTYILSGAQSWPNESETVVSPLPGFFNEIRLEIEEYSNPIADLFQQLFPAIAGLTVLGIADPSSLPFALPALGFILPSLVDAKFAVRGFSEAAEDELPGAQYQYRTAPVTSFRVEGPPADYVFSFEDRLIAIGGHDNPERVASSADGNPRIWEVVDPDLGLTGAFEASVLDSVSEPVEDMVAGGKVADNIAAILRKRSILRVEETGVLQLPLSIKDWKDGIGTESPKSVTQTPDGICFLGHDLMPYYFTGEQEPTPIGKHVWQTLVEDIQPSSLLFVEGKYDETLSEWWLGIPEDGGTGITGFWIFDLGRYRSRREEVWRYKPAVGIEACLPATISPPGVGVPPPAPPPEEEPPFVPPEPTVPRAVLTGRPFEVIEVASTGMVWVGYILSDTLGIGGTDLLVRVFDPLTAEKIQELTFPTHLSALADNYSMCYHPTRNEVWILGWGTTLSDARIAVVDAATYAQKAYYDYSFTSQMSIAAGIEHCPANGKIYACLSDSNTLRIAEIDPATGAVLEWQTYTGADSFAHIEDGNLVWDSARSRFVVTSDTHVFVWDFDPVSNAASGRVGGLIVHTGNAGERQPAFLFDSVYYAPDRKFDLYKWTGALGGFPSVFKSYNGDATHPGAWHCTPVPSLGGVAVSRSHDNNGVGASSKLVSSLIDIYKPNGDILRRLQIGRAIGRIVYAPRADCMVSLDAHDVNDGSNLWGVNFTAIGGKSNVPEIPPEVPKGNPLDPKPNPAPTPEPEPNPPAGEAITITAIRPWCTSTITEDAPPGSGLYSGTVTTGFEVEFSPDPDPNLDIQAFQSGKNPDTSVDAASGSVKILTGKWRTTMFTETVTSRPKELTPFCLNIQRDEFDTFWDVYIKNTSTGQRSNKANVRVFNPRAVFVPGDEPSPPIPDPAVLNPPTWRSASQKRCNLNGNQFPGEAPQTPTDWSGRVTISVYLQVHHGNGNPLEIPIEFLEFTAGANPAVATPLRRAVGSGGDLDIVVDHTFVIWQYDLHHTNQPTCLGSGSVPDLTRDYYARHILGDGKYGPLSALQSFTFKHPGP